MCPKGVLCGLIGVRLVEMLVDDNLLLQQNSRYRVTILRTSIITVWDLYTV